MSERTEQALLIGATALLGAAVVIGTAIRAAEHVNRWLRWQVEGEPIEATITTP